MFEGVIPKRALNKSQGSQEVTPKMALKKSYVHKSEGMRPPRNLKQSQKGSHIVTPKRSPDQHLMQVISVSSSQVISVFASTVTPASIRITSTGSLSNFPKIVSNGSQKNRVQSAATLSLVLQYYKMYRAMLGAHWLWKPQYLVTTDIYFGGWMFKFRMIACSTQYAPPNQKTQSVP